MGSPVQHKFALITATGEETIISTHASRSGAYLAAKAYIRKQSRRNIPKEMIDRRINRIDITAPLGVLITLTPKGLPITHQDIIR